MTKHHESLCVCLVISAMSAAGCTVSFHENEADLASADFRDGQFLVELSEDRIEASVGKAGDSESCPSMPNLVWRVNGEEFETDINRPGGFSSRTSGFPPTQSRFCEPPAGALDVDAEALSQGPIEIEVDDGENTIQMIADGLTVTACERVSECVFCVVDEGCSNEAPP